MGSEIVVWRERERERRRETERDELLIEPPVNVSHNAICSSVSTSRRVLAPPSPAIAPSTSTAAAAAI
jgi:hypothetical protein